MSVWLSEEPLPRFRSICRDQDSFLFHILAARKNDYTVLYACGGHKTARTGCLFLYKNLPFHSRPCRNTKQDIAKHGTISIAIFDISENIVCVHIEDLLSRRAGRQRRKRIVQYRSFQQREWIKEGKYGLKRTRVSSHDFVDNQVRVQFYALAYNLGNFRLLFICRFRCCGHLSDSFQESYLFMRAV